MKLKEYPEFPCQDCKTGTMKPREWAMLENHDFGVWYYCKACKNWTLRTPKEVPSIAVK